MGRIGERVVWQRGEYRRSKEGRQDEKKMS